MNIKICGITNLQDAFFSIESGANMLGFNFYQKSPRYIDSKKCEEIISILRTTYPTVNLVGIFVNHNISEVIHIMDTCGLHLAQFSGDETIQDIMKLKGRAYKTIRGSNFADVMQSAEQYKLSRTPPDMLVDTYIPDSFGGSGMVGNWKIAASLAERYKILLAGGLNPENVSTAIQKVKPWGVDVATGVETYPGKKDPVKLRDFIQAAISES